MRYALRSKNLQGFTIVELLIVIVIIGILAAIVIVSYTGLQSSAIDKGVSSDLDGVQAEVTRYQLKNGGYLSSDNSGSGVTWYSGGAVNTNITFTPSGSNVIDVVANKTDYCIRAYNTSASTKKSLTTAAYKESTAGTCDNLAPSNSAIAGDPTYGADYANLTWTQRIGPGMKNWKAVASSADGTKLAAVVNSGFIYTSTDSGATWTQRDSSRSWTNVASSADGTKLVATTYGFIYTSTDSGATWTQRASGQYWESIASSANGTILYAGTSTVSMSTDSGVTWTVTSAPFAGSSWYTLAVSADGTKVVGGPNNNYVYTSSDSGATWVQRTTSGSNFWYKAISSSSGTKIAISQQASTAIISTDSGATWTDSGQGAGYCAGLGGSADGSKLIASTNSTTVGRSINGGATWTASTPGSAGCYDIFAMSADGKKIIAAQSGEYLYTGLYSQ
ncbi:MAG: prepilin-type N-terminal cleavage/methylation domain-containing protein [Candidatus Saccharimonadales bacterium]